MRRGRRASLKRHPRKTRKRSYPRLGFISHVAVWLTYPAPFVLSYSTAVVYAHVLTLVPFVLYSAAVVYAHMPSHFKCLWCVWLTPLACVWLVLM